LFRLYKWRKIYDYYCNYYYYDDDNNDNDNDNNTDHEDEDEYYNITDEVAGSDTALYVVCQHWVYSLSNTNIIS